MLQILRVAFVFVLVYVLSFLLFAVKMDDNPTDDDIECVALIALIIDIFVFVGWFLFK